jgi:VanZ family protein
MSETAGQLQVPSPASRIYYWLPPLVWMGAIFLFSTDHFSVRSTCGTLASILRWLAPQITAAQIETVQLFVRKAGHFTVYAVLAALLMRAFRSGSPARWQATWAAWTLAIVAAYALLDEYHQSFTRHRSASIYDSLIDTVGGAAMIFAWWLWSLRQGAR